MTMGAVQAQGTVADPLGEHGAQLESRPEFHGHAARQVILGEQWQRAAVDRVLAEHLQTSSTR